MVSFFFFLPVSYELCNKKSKGVHLEVLNCAKPKSAD